MKKLILFTFLFSCLLSQGQTRDSIIITPRIVTEEVCYDTTYIVYDTTIIQVAVNTTLINMYSRSSLYTEAGRTTLAAFVKKAKERYGIKLITVDVRMTNANELPGWKAYLAKYN